MAESTSHNEVMTLTTEIVAAHVANNSVAVADLPDLIQQVFRSLTNAGDGGAEPPRPQPAVSVTRSVRPDYIVCLELQTYRKDFARAEIEADMALALQPTHPETLGNLGYFLWRAGRPEDEIRMLEKAVRLDPYHPPHFLAWLGHSYFMAGKCDEAIRALREGIAREPDYIAFHLNLAACYALAGRGAEAGAAASEVLRLNPNFTLRAYEGFVVYKNWGGRRSPSTMLRPARTS